jgi:hypothetical protein
MKNDPDEIQFDCPKCQRPMSGDKALLGEMVNCPDCGEPFFPTPRKPEPAKPSPEAVAASAQLNELQVEAPRAPSAQNDAISALVKLELTKQREKIRNQANRFTGIAGLFCGIGLLIAILSLAQAISGDGAGSGFIVAGSLIGSSLWF